MKRIIYLVCIHLLCSTAAQASNLRQISSREGISNNAILSLAQDKHGFIWVGSCDGLNMWDGERMRLFPNDWGEYTPLSGNLIEEIAVTTDSLFWIRTNYGLDLIAVMYAGHPNGCFKSEPFFPIKIVCFPFHRRKNNRVIFPLDKRGVRFVRISRFGKCRLRAFGVRVLAHTICHRTGYKTGNIFVGFRV